MRVEFLSELVVRHLYGERWYVEEPFHFSVDGTRFRVPEAYETDFDSVPRLPLAYWLTKGRAKKSAVVHDYLYSMQIGKAYADKVFLAAMETEGVSYIYRKLMYAAVVMFGDRAYAKHAPDAP